MWWISLISVIVGGIIVGIFTLLNTYYMRKREYREWLRQKKVKIVEELLEVWSELDACFSPREKAYLGEPKLIVKRKISELLKRLRKLTSLMELYFSKKVWSSIKEPIMELGTKVEDEKLELERIWKGEASNKVKALIKNIIERSYTSLRGELDITR